MDPYLVSPAGPQELTPALRLLFGGEVPALDCRDDVAVFVARDAGWVGGAVLAQALPGALGVAWPPRAESPGAADALVRAACDWLRRRGVKVCQAFASAAQLPDADALTRNGFRRVTQLVSMRREVEPLPAAPTTGGLAFRPASPLAAEFRDALLTTHDGTLDCPELNGERSADELLAGLTEPAPDTAWYLASEAGGERAVGVVILATGPGEVELSYLGVVPAARGRGVGGELVQFALSEAAAEGAVAVAVSADARNEPALRIYRRLGFTETERREVFLAEL